MPYPNFGLVRTITLPYEEDLTTAQYLERYGIDLSTLELYDLVNIALDDVVYPVLYVDTQNKKLLMADRAFSYAGGLSATSGSLIESVIASGSITNAKPLYWHGINLQAPEVGGQYAYQMTMVIINNTPTKLETWASLKQAILDFGANALIQLNGYYDVDNEGIANAIFLFTTTSNIVLVGNDTSCQRVAVTKSTDGFDAIFGAAGAVVEDRVNKLN